MGTTADTVRPAPGGMSPLPTLLADADQVPVGAQEDLAVRDRRRRVGPFVQSVDRDHVSFVGSGLKTTVVPRWFSAYSWPPA